MLTFAATGRGPFGAGSNAALMYRLVNSPADLSSVPDELRSLVGSCLAKNPGDRPTARELLAEVGALQPAPGWLAESIMNSFIQDPPAPSADLAAVGGLIALTEAPGPAAATPVRRRDRRRGRTRAASYLPDAGLGRSHRRPGGGLGRGRLRPDRRQPHPGVQPPPAAGRRGCGGDRARLASGNAAAGPRTSSSASPSASARVSPNVYLSPALSRVSSTSLPPTPTRIPVVRAADQIVQPDQAPGVLAARVVSAGLVAAGLLPARVVAARVLAPRVVAPGVFSARVVAAGLLAPRVVAPGVVSARVVARVLGPGEHVPVRA